jgi:P-type Ca2+ transporter type 2C
MRNWDILILNGLNKIMTFPGLTASQAREKLLTDGYNSLPSSKPKNFFSIALGVVKEPMFILLVACGSLYMIMGDIQEGVMLLGFVLVIMGKGNQVFMADVL